ncbi:hypothetical protein KR093_006774 [Drosophila rubida]|uniref:Uncharacterized protein n=1 Tax=Drosophila rubida TaxID=30044 RepID=A0AAD4PK28_9MUSC|nr:hypothetical protein KR093_006774 [Drosophila rubida]
MPNRREGTVENMTIIMVLLRIFLTILYLWLMLFAAAVIPEINRVTTGHLWFKTHETFVQYSSMLSIDGFTVPIVTALILLMLYRLYKCCRCNFFGWVYYTDTIRSGDKVPFDTKLLFYFGPYLMLFLLYWISSVCYIFKILEFCAEPTKNRSALYCQIIMSLLFKLLVLSNMLIRCNRCFAILKQFDKETRDYLLNSHNFGEHLNLFFQH